MKSTTERPDKCGLSKEVVSQRSGLSKEGLLYYPTVNQGFMIQ